MIRIDSDNLNFKCCYTLLSPASHHDPNIGGQANLRLYNRQQVRVPWTEAHKAAIRPEHKQVVAEAFPVPEECTSIFEGEPFARFVAIAITREFIKRYRVAHGDGDWGTGIFTGVEAYRRLTERIEMAAPRSKNLKEFWSILLRDMQCGPSTTENAANLFKLLGVPLKCHHEVLFHFQKYAAMIVEMARFWIEKSKSTMNSHPAVFEENTQEEHSEVSVAIPCHSGNDLRHDIRYGGMVHLLNRLGMDLNTQLPVGVKALLENGGNIKKGATAPSTAFALTQIIREKYPIIGLLGGCADGFILGESNLHSVSAFWYGKEFNDALQHIFNVTAEHSVVDMLDQWTLHRHVTYHDGSPMPYSFETIAAGAKLFVNFTFSPWISELELGAFYRALKTFEAVDATIGGQSAKGFGKIKIDILENPPDDFVQYAEKYDEYLHENLNELSEGLQQGTLCTGQTVCS